MDVTKSLKINKLLKIMVLVTLIINYYQIFLFQINQVIYWNWIDQIPLEKLFIFILWQDILKKLPENWNKIPGANGCTLENCSFRDNYEKFIELNSIPIGISTQTVEDIYEMTLDYEFNMMF